MLLKFSYNSFIVITSLFQFVRRPSLVISSVRRNSRCHLHNCWQQKNYSPLKTGFLFSRKAVVPSTLSAVAKQSPKAFTSNS